MPLNLGELSVKLSADMSQFTATLNSAQRSISTSGAKMQQQFDGFGESVSGLLLPIGKLTEKLEKTSEVSDKAGSGVKGFGRHAHDSRNKAKGLVDILSDMHTQMNLLMGGAALSATFTAPFAMMTRAAFDTSIGFESAFAGVRKTVEATEEEFAELEKRFRSMSKTTPIAAEEFARIGELAGQLGVRGVDNLSAFSDTIAKLAVTTNLSTEEAATSLARFANIMQMPMGQVDRLGSTIVDLGNNFATTEQEITQFGLRIAGAGKQIGLSESEILAFGTALSSVGINAEMGGTAISRVFAELAKVISKGGEDLEMFASVAGMSAEAFAQAFRDDAAMASIAFIEGLDEIKNAGGNVFRVLESLNLENERVRSTLLRTSGAGDVLRRSIELSSKAWEENTALTIEAEKRFKTTESQIKIMQNNFKEAARSIGDTFAPALNTAVDVFKSVAEAAQGMPPGLHVLVVAFGGLLAAIGPAMLALAGFGAVSAGVKSALPVLGLAFAKLANPISLAVIAVAGLAAAIGVFRVKQKEAREQAQRQAETLVKLTDQYRQLTEKVNDSTASGEEHNQAFEDQKKLIQEIGEAFPQLVEAWDMHGRAVSLDTQLLDENTKAAGRNLAISKEQEEQNARDDITRVQRRIARLREEQKIAADSGRKIREAYASMYDVHPENLDQKFDIMVAEQQRALTKARDALADIYRQRSSGMDPNADILSSTGPRPPSDPKSDNKNTKDNEEENDTKKKYLEDFEKAFDRSQEDMRDTFTRAQEDATGVFKDEQDKRLRAFEAAQETEKTAFLRTLDERKVAFENQLDEEKTAFQRGQNDRKVAFERNLDEEKTAFSRAQNDRKVEFEQGLSDEKTVFERAQQEKLDSFKRTLEDQKTEFARAQDDQKIAFDRAQSAEKDAYQRTQEDLLDAFKDRQSAELDALKNRYDNERALIDAGFGAKLKELRAKQDSIKATEAEEERNRRLAQMQQRVADAREAVNEAEKKGDPKKVADAQRRLNEALQDQQDFLAKETRKAELDRIQEQIDALRTETDNSKKALQKRQNDETEALRNRQEVQLRDYRRQLDDEKNAFEERLAEAKVQFQRALAAESEQFQRQQEGRLAAYRVQLDDEKKAFEESQAERKRQYAVQQDDEKKAFEEAQAEQKRQYTVQQEDEKKAYDDAQAERKRQYGIQQEDQKKAYADQQEEAKRSFQDLQEAEMTAWKRLQENRATQYKRELDDLKASFADKLDEQRRFISDWNAMAAQMRALAPGADGGVTLPPLAPTTTPEPTPEGTGGGGGGGPIFAMAKGGIVKRPTLAMIGEGGEPEVVSPLSRLRDLMGIDNSGMQAMAGRVQMVTGYGYGGRAMEPGTQAVAALGGGLLDIKVFIGERQLEDLWVEMATRAQRRGRTN